MDIFPKAVQPLRRVEPTTKSVFDEAREYIDAWEKAEPRAANIGLVLGGEVDLVVSVAGADLRPSAAAGLFFSAAIMVAA